MSQLVVMSPEDLKETIKIVMRDVLINQQKSEPEKRNLVLVLPEAADYCRMPIATFREYLGRKEIRGAKVGKSWRFFTEDLDQFLKKYLRKTNADIKKEIDEQLSK